ncbi:MAG: outer membrane beta-barrel protein [Muribaculaceae bacterium]|nr:outer membrane beta-barrel protein [Muribaculaceae bacterium]
MKRCPILIILVAVMAVKAMAGEKPFFDTTRSDDFIEVELHAMVGATTVGENYADCIDALNELHVTPGCGIGLGASVRFVIRDFLALGTQMDFRINNSRYDMTLVTPSERMSTVYLSNHSYDVNLPIFMSFRFNVADNVRWYADGGVFFALGFGGYQKADIYNTYNNSLGQMVTSHVHEKHEYFRDEFPVIHNVADFDIGLHFATGLVFNRHYTAGVAMQIGLRDLADDTPVFAPEMRNRSCMLKIGYIF